MAEERMQQARDPGAIRAAPGRDLASDPAARRRPLPRGWDEPVSLDADPAVVPDPAEVPVPDELRREIEAYMARYPDRHSAALPALGAAQRRYGWCSPRALLEVAAVMQVTPAYLSSLATFYDMLRTEPRGSRYVYVCTSVACHLRDAKRVHDAIAAEARRQGLEDTEVREFECLGACDMAPMASIDGRYVGPLDVTDAAEIVSAIKNGRTVLPGRGLEDADYRLPWDTEVAAARSAGPEARADDQRPPGREQTAAPPTPPDVSPPGGTVKDRDEEGMGQ
ncbi:MAG TPA: NAD(P)H-dependent oxidoreductase subunit E [Thermoleophilaceae bacterium]|jgi:NADH:ubiquinone oxidoreductase subunit E|nr:NAD(P)H-dependent oxidoreductase subunit E [Thermoleophilaceae bacterium]